jgi:superfamily II DNA or RNA helicase
MEITLSPGSIDDYHLFLKVKALPRYRIVGRTAVFPDEYAERLGIGLPERAGAAYEPIGGLFDYQEAVAGLAIRKRKFCAFVKCGYGKSLIQFEFARHAQRQIGPGRRTLIVAPLMVVSQHIREAKRFYGDSLPIEQVRASDLERWMHGTGGTIGITNYESLTDQIEQGNLGCLIADESSTMKSAYGKWGTRLIELGRGLEWKLALTGTPAPNDRIEFANHAVFMDACPNVNSFLAKYFINKGKTSERWEMKAHAVKPFYHELSDWSIFVNNPGTYGWKDNAGTIPPVNIHIHDVELTADQDQQVRDLTGTLFAMNPGGIVGRSKMARIAKGGDSLKPAYIKGLVDSWPDESTIVWCRFNEEQDGLAKVLVGSASIQGKTPQDERERIIADFQAGRTKTLISKAEVIGFGLNLQIATRHIFSSCQDSWESFHQAISRSNRVGSTKPLEVYIPTTEIERPMIETVLAKAKRNHEDMEIQEAMFKETRTCC